MTTPSTDISRIIDFDQYIDPARSGTLRNDIDGAPASAAAPVDHPLRQRPYAERLRFDWNAAITGLITDQEDGH